MSIHGERYANVNQFVAYCRELNVKTDERELEYYEKIGAMLPVARVVYPDNYVIQMGRYEIGDANDGNWQPEWSSLLKLEERVMPFLFSCRDLPDEQLIHCFDREFEAGNNPYLSRPECTRFRPWSEYAVTVDDTPGKEIERPTAEHYYSCWQVHQLYFIRKFSGFYRGQHSIDPLPSWLTEFSGKRHRFDALSFWNTMYQREKGRTFANVAEKNGIRRLDADEASAYRERQVKLAVMAMGIFGLTPQDLYRLACELVELYEEYEQDERYKLAEALKQDIFSCEHLLNLLTEESREEIAGHLGVFRQTFRHLSIATKEHDYAFSALIYVAQKSISDLQNIGCSDWSFTESDCNALLDYCQQEGFGILPYALSGMNAVGFDEFRRQSRRVLMYTNIKNVLTAYEYLLKHFGEKCTQSVSGRTLTQAVNVIMKNEPWFERFTLGQKLGLLNGKSVDEFLENLEELLSDDNLNNCVEGFWARAFLVTCLARNMTVHSYPNDDRYYGDLFGPMLDAVILAMLYTWKMAQREKWI